MPLTDTTTKPVFIEVQPDWNRPVVLKTSWETSIFVNRESGEQRTRQMRAPKLQLSYERRAQSPSTFALQRRKAAAQLGNAVVVPVWTHWETLATNGGNSVVADATITSLKFKVGGWIYVKQGASACFRKITSVSGATINLSSDGDDFEPVGFTFAVFTAGARIYPCILGLREGSGWRMKMRRPDRSDATFSVVEL